MSENERVKELRKSLGLTMEQFGSKIGIQKSMISRIESGDNKITDRTRLSICREFNVREEWLRDGEGEMQADVTGALDLNELVSRLALNETEHTAVVHLLKKYFELSPDTRQEIMDTFLSGLHQPEADTRDPERDEDIEAEVEEYRRERYKEKEELRQAGSSGSAKTG